MGKEMGTSLEDYHGCDKFMASSLCVYFYFRLFVMSSSFILQLLRLSILLHIFTSLIDLEARI